MFYRVSEPRFASFSDTKIGGLAEAKQWAEEMAFDVEHPIMLSAIGPGFPRDGLPVLLFSEGCWWRIDEVDQNLNVICHLAKKEENNAMPS